MNNDVKLVDTIQKMNSPLTSSSETLKFIPTADLIIITNSKDALMKNTNGLIDKHTIISKILSEDVFYIEDSFKDIHIFITPENTYIFKGHGVDTKLLSESEYRNT